MVIGSEVLQNQPKSDKATWIRAAELALGRSLRDNDQASATATFLPIFMTIFINPSVVINLEVLDKYLNSVADAIFVTPLMGCVSGGGRG